MKCLRPIQKLLATAAALLVLTSAPGGTSALAYQGQAEILVVCDYNPSERQQERVTAVLEILTYMNKSYLAVRPDVQSVEGYHYIIIVADAALDFPRKTAEMLLNTETPILVIGAGCLDELIPGAISVQPQTFTAEYQFPGGEVRKWLGGGETLLLLPSWDNAIGGTITIDDETMPLCAGIGSISAIPWFDEQDGVMFHAMTNLISQWMWPFENDPVSYGVYLVLKDVYPFEDPERMLRITQMLMEEGVPYAISVMPIYENAYFPAMGRFCEYLKYAQAHGAAILLRTPHTIEALVESEDILEYMTLAFEAYTQWGVYPQGFTAPRSYLFTEKGLDVLRASRTVFLFEDGEMPELTSDINMAYADGHNIIAGARVMDPDLHAYGFSNAIYLDIYEDLETLTETVKACKSSTARLRSIEQMTNSIYLGLHHLSADPVSGVFLNGEKIALEYIPAEIPENFDYKRGIAQFFVQQMENVNVLLIALVIISGTIFSLFIYLARRKVKQEFIVKNGPNDGPGKYRNKSGGERV